MRSKAFKNIKLYLVCLIVAISFAAIYSTTTTPLLSGKWGTDSAFFILVGQGMTKGLMPYRDFFDMKGPYLFFIEYLGQLISYGRTGAFIIQCINFSICFYIIGKTSDLFANRLIWLHRLFAFIPALFVLIVTLQGGNLTEEYCLPWILMSLYLCLKYFKQAQDKKDFKHPVWFSLYNGAAVGIICFIRITSAATIGAVLLTVFIVMLAKKEIKNLLLNLVMVIAGFAVTSAIPCAFFYSKGMLKEMLDQVFLFGVTYSSEIGFTEKLGNVFSTFKLFLLLILLPVVVCMIYREKWYVKLLSICSALLILVAVTMGNAYLHYFMLLVPHIVLGICIAYKNGGKILKVRKNIVCIICCTLLFVANSVWIVKSAVKGCFTLYSYAISEQNSGALDGLTEKLMAIPSVAENIYTGEENIVALDVASHIPESDRDSVYCFGDEYWSWWYGVTGILPDYKYMDWHANYMELIPDLDNEIAAWIANDGSTWIVTIKDENISDEVSGVIAENYTEEYSNEKYTLYRRNG